MKKTTLFKTMLLLCALIVGSGSAWADKTYKLTKVTSVSAGNKYVFEISNHVLTTVSSSAVQSTNTYSKSGLTGKESYIWELTSATNGFYMKMSDGKFLNNSSGTGVTAGNSGSSIWTFSFTSGIALIKNSSNSNRFLGDTGASTPAYTYKAYATGNLSTYPHDFTVYQVEEETGVTSLAIESAPDKVRYEVGETLDMTGFALDADGTSVTSGYTMTIGGSSVENGDALNSQGKKTIVVSYGGKTVNQNISVGAVTGIEVTTPPTKTTYDAGDNFVATGMVVTASLSTGENSDPDEWTQAVTGYTVTPTTFEGLETYVTITYSGKETTQDVTVNRKAVTDVSLNKASTSITYGNKETLTATIAPADATITTVSWTSSNESVATVKDGVVTAMAVGTATITVTTTDGSFTDECVVTVTANSSKPSLTETIFEETFANVSSNENAAIDLDELDNSGWTKDGDVYGNDGTYGARMAKGKGGGSLTTPAISGMKTGAVVSFKARGWDDDETTISLSGTNCTVSPTSFTDLSYTSLSNKEVTVTVTGDNPKITFSAASGVRIKIDDIVITQTKSTADVKLSATGYASYCSPFALDLTPTDDYAAYAVTGTDDTSVTFSKIPGKVAANTPFILFNEDNARETVNLPIIEDDDAGIAAVSGNMLAGTLSPTYVTTVNGDYTNFGLSGGSFVKINAGTIPANKAYLPVLTANVPNEARAFNIVFEDGETTGIKNVEVRKFNAETYYNLAGQRVDANHKGIVIVNGKKFFNK